MDLPWESLTEAMERGRQLTQICVIRPQWVKNIYAGYCSKHPARVQISLQWRRNEREGVSNHQCLDCFLNHLFRRRSKKTQKLCVTGLYDGNHWWPVDSPHKGPITRKMLPFDDVIACSLVCKQCALNITQPVLIRSSDNDSTGFWPPGSLHTLGADGHI